MSGFLAELKRRRVLRVVAVYAITAWIVVQVADTAGPLLLLPDWFARAVLLLALLGLPITAVLGWAFDITSEGIRRTETSTFSSRAAIVLALLVTVLGTSGWWFYGRGHGPRGADDKSIAVLPFQSLSADQENQYFSDGVQGELITNLSRISDLTVISQTSVMGYRDRNKNLREIARELGVATIVEGSVQKVGARVRIQAQLIDARTDRHLWAETYERELSDVFAIQTDVARRIAEALQTRLTPEQNARLEKKPTENLEAYDLYLRANAMDDNTLEHTDQRIELYRQAIALDPNFAAAFAALAWRHQARGENHGFGSAEADSTIALARKAIALDPMLAAGYRTLGLGLRMKGRLSEAAVAVNRAVELDPNFGAAMNSLSHIAAISGNYDDAVYWARRGLPLDPRYAQLSVNLGRAYMLLSQDEKARQSFANGRSVAPGSTLPARGEAILAVLSGDLTDAQKSAREAMALDTAGGGALFTNGYVAAASGDWQAARRFYERLYARSADATDSYLYTNSRLALAHALERTGDRARAAALADQQMEEDERMLAAGGDHPDILLRLAAVHALRGNRALALDRLEQAYLAGFNDHRHLATSTMFDSLRGEPRFKKLLEHMNVRVAAMWERVAAQEAKFD